MLTTQILWGFVLQVIENLMIYFSGYGPMALRRKVDYK
jgi:hypothetical protein